MILMVFCKPNDSMILFWGALLSVYCGGEQAVLKEESWKPELWKHNILEMETFIKVFGGDTCWDTSADTFYISSVAKTHYVDTLRSGTYRCTDWVMSSLQKTEVLLSSDTKFLQTVWCIESPALL